MKKTIYIIICLFTCFSCKNEQKELAQISPADISNVKTDSIKGDFAGGTLLRIDDFPSNYIPPRKVDIWLPENYSKEKKYAVIYMHDGQMLFDSRITWNHQEWKVDEMATKLMNDSITKDFIVVAPFNINELRHSEYFPQKPFESLSESVRDSLIVEANKNDFKFDSVTSDNYLRFIVKELKPYVDKNYSVLTNQESTFVMGSSMGGLISMYAICEYPKVFGGAACLSTHWPGGNPNDSDLLADTFFEYMKSKVPSPKNHKFYFDYGTETLDKFYPKYAPTINKIFKDLGYDQSNFENLKFKGADHSEVSWQKRLDIPLTFLLKKQ
ncbi:MAG: alpha/beta hydrolase-fold protein [Aquaticitalea sp.]